MIFKDASKYELHVYKRKNLGLVEPASIRAKTSQGANEINEPGPVACPIVDPPVPATKDDHNLTKMPSLCRDFTVPMDLVGDLLQVWNFCTSFGELLNLSRFSLKDFEDAICYKGPTPTIIVESCISLIDILMNNNKDFLKGIEAKKWKPKITPTTWIKNLCDFLERYSEELSTHIGTIKSGGCPTLAVHVKLDIYKFLIERALETDIFRDKFEELDALARVVKDEKSAKKKKRRGQEEQVKESGEENDKSGSACGEDGNENLSKSKIMKNAREDKKKRSRGQEEHVKKSGEEKGKSSSACGEDGNENQSKLKIMKKKKMIEDIKEEIEAKSPEQRIEYLEKEIENISLRSKPLGWSLGKDKDYRRYWFFQNEGRIFIENFDSSEGRMIPESSKWGFYQTKEELDALIDSLDTKCEREKALKDQLQKFYAKICSEMQKRSEEEERRIGTEERRVRRPTRTCALRVDSPALAFLKYENKWKNY